jgi:hypothetical protein
MMTYVQEADFILCTLNAQSLSSEEKNSWEKWIRVGKEILPQASSRRIESWSLARVCLALILKNNGYDLLPQEIHWNTTLTKVGYRPGGNFSLTHTVFENELYGAAVYSQTKIVGVDVEHLDRKIKPEILARICSADERAEGSPHFLWTAKEAAYKVFSHLKHQEKISNVTEIQIDAKALTAHYVDFLAQLKCLSFENHLLQVASLNSLRSKNFLR